MMIDVDVDELMRDQAEDQREESSYPRGTSLITHDFILKDKKIFHKKRESLDSAILMWFSLSSSAPVPLNNDSNDYPDDESTKRVW